MNQDLSVWHLIINASATVQFIMFTLLLASVVSWYIIAQRNLYFRAVKRNLKQFEQKFWSGNDLTELYREGSARLDKGKAPIGMESIFRAGFKEFSRLSQQSRLDSDAVMEGCQRAMRVALSREEELTEKHLPFLATVGSTSPYVGLLGTVWGIMTSFQSLANVNQATLATVAPGISEALVATAMGLFAAIPAVVAYNRFSSQADWLSNKYETFTEEFSSILHRQVHARQR